MDFYEPHLARLRDATRVLEYGVFHGDSIRYLVDRFPRAHVVGCDILSPQDEWPRGERIEYVTLDQGRPDQLEELFRSQPQPFDLVIEDGSHLPQHQKNCLIATVPHVRDKGVYILEDLHTSHPSHAGMPRRHRGRTNCYHLLLAFEHLRVIEAPLTDEAVDRLTRRSLFNPEEVRSLFERIAKVEIYRRAALPLRCYRCGSEDFAYDRLACRCGVELAATADSISAVLTVTNGGAL